MKKEDLKLVEEISLEKMIDLLPYGIGPIINETINFRKKRQQERLNNFFEKLKKFMANMSEEDINFDRIASEDFLDIFESILKRVAYSKSEEKLNIFRKILTKEMKVPCCSEYSETFLDIILQINEKQIQILSTYRENENNDDMNSDYRKCEFYDIDKDEYTFYIQDLTSKGFLIDDSVGRYGAQSMEYLKITQFGIKFLEFIEE